MKKGKVIIVLLIIIIGIIGIIFSRNEEVSNEINTNIESNETKIVLYFSNEKTGELEKEYRHVKFEEIKNNMEETIINELLKGPENGELSSAIPEDTKLNSLNIEESKIIIDFSKEFGINSEDELKNLHKIYSVVNSLTEITEINEVEIKVEGENFTNKVRL